MWYTEWEISSALQSISERHNKKTEHHQKTGRNASWEEKEYGMSAIGISK